MKKIISLFSVLVLLSCGNKKSSSIEEVIKTKDLKQIQQKRNDIQKQLDALLLQVEKLDVAIAELDTIKKNTLVKVTPVNDTIFKHYIEVQGNVETKENILVYPEFQGVLTQLNVKVGQNVTKGQVLAKIDDAGLGAQLAQAETQLALATTTFERQKNLWEQKIGSEIQYLQAKTNMESQQKIIQQIKAQINKTLVRAPFNGTIDAVNVERGQVVAPGTALFRVVSLRDMYVSANIPEAYLQNLKLGAPVEVYLQAIGKTYSGKVRQIGKNINPANRTLAVEIALPNPENLLRPNQVAALKIEDYVNPKAIVIADVHFTEKADGSKVCYVVQGNLNSNQEGLVKEVAIEIGKFTNNQVEVRSGLQNGDLLVTEGVKQLKDQSKITIIK